MQNTNLLQVQPRTLKTFSLNFGPQHPAAHGVLRLILELNGELVHNVTPHIGLLHRGTEKLIESKNVLQALPYLDRLDYVSMMSNEHAYSMAVEGLAQLNVPLRGQYIRLIFVELTRILNHIMAVTTHAMDVGALTPFLWLFEEREKLMEFYERVSGARMHAAYIRPGGVAYDVPLNMLNDIYKFVHQFSSRIDEVEELLTQNRIWVQRLKRVGIITDAQAKNWAVTGVMARSCGFRVDLRKNEPYDAYRFMRFRIPTTRTGDCYDRYIIRIGEMRQSLSLILQAISSIPDGNVRYDNPKFTMSTRHEFKYDMDHLIAHFKLMSDSFNMPLSKDYVAVEGPKGEFGVSLVCLGGTQLHRCKFRAPGFFHLGNSILQMPSQYLADVVAIIGTQDIVFGEVDR